MCSDCERKDRVIEGLKDVVADKTKEGQIKTLFEDIRYPTIEHKQRVIDSLVRSGVDIELIREITNDLKRTQGLDHKHYC